MTSMNLDRLPGMLAVVALCGCAANPEAMVPRGSVSVSVVTTGPGIIPASYTIAVDEMQMVPVQANGTATIGDLTAGPHRIRLANIALQCTSDWYAPQTATVVADSSSAVAYSVQCDLPMADRIVFIRDVNVFTMRADGSQITPFDIGGLSGSQNIKALALSPGGTRLAYSTFDFKVGVVSIDGSTTNQVSIVDNAYADPDWSPDGTRLLVVRGNNQLDVITADGRLDSVLVPSHLATLGVVSPRWSPDGNRIAYVDDQQLKVMNLKTRQVINVRPPNNVDFVTSLAWSPAGDRIAYTGHGTYGALDVGIVRADGTGDAVIAPALGGFTVT